MTAESDIAPQAAPQIPRRRRRWLTGASRWALGIAVIALAGLLVIWSQRKPIADNYVQNLLAERGVPARYRIADIGFNRQRLTDLVIGDPAHPDLVADWVEVATSIGFSGVQVTGVRAGKVRMRAALTNGHLSLGALDRLLPPPSGKPFVLPAISLEVADGRMRLQTAAGLVGIKLTGHGRLENGFVGRAGVVAPSLAAGGCLVDRAAATFRLVIVDRQPGLKGPIRAASVRCGSTRIWGARADVAATLDERLDRWQGKAGVALRTLNNPAVAVALVTGSLDFSGSAKQTKGSVDLHSGDVNSAYGQAGSSALAGNYRVGSAGSGFQGSISGEAIALAPPWLTAIGGYGNAARGTPVDPLVAQLAREAQLAGRRFSLSADIAIRQAAAGIDGQIVRAATRSASGATVNLRGGTGIEINPTGIRLNGVLAMIGGGLPEGVINLSQAAPGAPVTGTALIRPYAAGDARLALAAVDFTASPDGATRISTRATLSGPLGTGRVEAATMPIAAYWNGHGRLRVNPGCAPLSFERLAISGLVLGKTQLGLCATGAALVSVDNGALSGGGRIAAPRLIGKLGSAPVSINASEAHFGLLSQNFGAATVKVRLGAPDRVSTLDVASITGRIVNGGVVGVFSGGAGQIAKVPLFLSGSAGDWRLADGKLTIQGGLRVADGDADPRFYPLVSKDVAFTLQGSAIHATGTLLEPDSGTRLSDVTLVHDLSTSNGHADLAIPGIAFGPKLQPDKLTRFTYGVIADVVGTVTGQGHIGWTGDGVTSDGLFRTTNTDLAAAFGPVTGLTGEIRFTDLLNMESAPGQVATVESINPGIPVLDGKLRYRMLPGSKVAVEGARWPFAGGELILEPSVLDFAERRDRRLTFRVIGVDAAQFLQQFDFKNLDATGTFDGVLPMIFDETGGRIEGGHLTVRESGGMIAYVGEISQKDLGFWANMAFQALKALRYKSLDIVMNGPLAGEMITEVRFAGINQGEGTKTNFLIKRLQKLPLIFNVRIQAPFRQLIDSAQSYYDPRRLIERNLPALIRAQNESLKAKPEPAPETEPKADKPVQPPASEPMP